MPLEEGRVIFCMKCRLKTTSNKLEDVTMKNGKMAVKGKCVKCGTGTYTIVKAG